jgi:hypothetical protein
VQVSDLHIDSKHEIVVISTYGRGMWVMDSSKVK